MNIGRWLRPVCIAFNRRKPVTASRMGATQPTIICPPRHRLTFRFDEPCAADQTLRGLV